MAVVVDAGSGGVGPGQDLGPAAQRGLETWEMREARGENATEKGEKREVLRGKAVEFTWHNIQIYFMPKTTKTELTVWW